MRNIVVRATTKVNGKTQILGYYSPQTPESIDLKFDLDDYVGHVTPLFKNGTNRPSSSGGGKGVKYNVQKWFFVFLFNTLLAKL